MVVFIFSAKVLNFICQVQLKADLNYYDADFCYGCRCLARFCWNFSCVSERKGRILCLGLISGQCLILALQSDLTTWLSHSRLIYIVIFFANSIASSFESFCSPSLQFLYYRWCTSERNYLILKIIDIDSKFLLVSLNLSLHSNRKLFSFTDVSVHSRSHFTHVLFKFVHKWH